MKRYALLVIGSGPAGVSAARGYLDAGGRGPVCLVSSDGDAPYERPPLSKEVLAGQRAPQGDPIDGESLPEAVELRLATTVSHVDPGERTVTAGEEMLGYVQLVVATGAGPLALPSVDPDADVHSLRSLDDARRLTRSAEHARTALVIGSGFIGCEAAASLAARGIDTTMVTVEAAPQRGRLGEHAAAAITDWLTGAGVTVRTGVSVTAVRAPRTVHLDADGAASTLTPDLVLVAIGVEPGAEFLGDSGLQVHEGRLVVDEHLQAAPGVWAAGDCARAMHAVAGRALAVEHWGDALAMGELAGLNAAEPDRPGSWSDVPGFWSTIGEHTLKYAAWGDGHARAEVDARPGRFTIWYGDESDRLVGVLADNADDDYERGEALIAQGADLAAARAGAHPPTGSGLGSGADEVTEDSDEGVGREG